MRHRLFRALLTTLAAVVAMPVFAQPPRSVSPIGRKIDDFTLADTSGKRWSLSDCKDAKAIVVVFVGTECPINNAYMPRLAELHADYTEQGVRFVAVNANRHDGAKRIAEHARRHEIPFPVLRDGNN